MLNITAFLFVTSILVQPVTGMSLSALCIRHLPNLTLFAMIQFSSVSVQSLCDPMGCSTPDFPVHPQLPELAQTHAIELVIAMFMLKYFSGKDEERGQDIGI